MGTGTQAAKDSAAQSTTDAPKPPAPLIAPTGDATWDTLASDINQAAAPFQDLSSKDASDLDRANDVIGGIMGAIMTPLNLLNDGFALLTAPIAKLFPPLPAATLGMLHLGIPHLKLRIIDELVSLGRFADAEAAMAEIQKADPTDS